MKLEGVTALITGASAGLGKEFARQLAARASTLIIVARRTDELEKLRNELMAVNSKLTVHVRTADLAKQLDLEELSRWLKEQQLHVDFLINNAGLGDHGPFATSDPERNVSMIQLNVLALTLLTHRLLPAMIASKRGAILNVSSSASFLPLPKLAVYAATKAYVTSFSEALRSELRGSGVSVTALCPGPVQTEFNRVAQRSNESSELAPRFTYVAKEEVARAALAAVENNRAVIVPGLAMKIAMTFVRLTPMPILRWAWRVAK